MDAIWNYYREAAARTGRDPKTGRSMGFSLEFFFCKSQPQEQNALVRAFLGDVSLPPAGEPLPWEELMPYVSQVTPPYPEQLRAIARALASPVSLVQGPPGTGKTETILNLIAVIRRMHPEKTIAVVSTNHEALNNIYEKLEEGRASDPMLKEIYGCFAVLGSKQNVKDWREQREALGEDVSAIDPSGRPVDPAYLGRYPVFSSTVHSLRKIFDEKTGFDHQFDFVIADECSQMSVMLGMIAMSCARQLVVIGDDQQLTPIIHDSLEELAKERGDVPLVYMEQEGKSFLSACGEVFPGLPSTLLNMHYRCHPSIIGFCNQYIYDNQLQVAVQDDGAFCMRAVWYEGDYCEKHKEARPTQEESGERARYQTQNRRQVEILLREELPRLAQRLRDPKFSVAVICPFRGPIEQLGQLLPQRLRGLGLEDQEVSDNLDVAGGGEDRLAMEDIPRLTIHRAQGKGFSAVFLLTAEDYYKGEEAWCQQKRLVNVAVSRAKRELTVITSSQWLPEELQQELTGYVLPNGQEKEPAKGMYYRKLLAYIAERCPQPQGEFGLHRSGVTSVFDHTPRLRRISGAKRGSREEASAPARCVAQALAENFGEEYTVLSELPLTAVAEATAVTDAPEELLAYREHSRIDFALCQENQVRLLIEVDGAYHREEGSEVQRNDQRKDRWIELLQAESCFLRLPTDGSGVQEMEAVRQRLAFSSQALTVTEQGLSEALSAARARYRLQQLLADLTGMVDEHQKRLREFLAREDMTGAQKLDCIRMDFSHAEKMRYNVQIRNSFYLCRYAMAYAFEYAMLYDLAMRLHRQSGSNTLGVFSFGAGSLLDAWSMAYARARLTLEEPAYEALKLYYKGVDEQLWDSYFVAPQRICPSDGRDEPSRAEQSPDFEKLWLCHSGIAEFLDRDILSRKDCRLYYETLVFPKIVNELKEEDVEAIEERLGRVRLTYPVYYLLVSHSRYQLDRSGEILERFVRALDPEGRYERCSDIHQLLSPENQQAFRSAWAAWDRLVPLLPETAGGPRGYAFESSLPSAEGKEARRPFPIRALNQDFAYDGPRPLLRGVEALQEQAGAVAFPCQQVQKVSAITFDVIRLKKKEA